MCSVLQVDVGRIDRGALPAWCSPAIQTCPSANSEHIVLIGRGNSVRCEIMAARGRYLNGISKLLPAGIRTYIENYPHQS